MFSEIYVIFVYLPIYFLEQVIQLRKACSHPYLFPGIEPEPFEEGEHLVQVSQLFTNTSL